MTSNKFSIHWLKPLVIVSISLLAFGCATNSAQAPTPVVKEIGGVDINKLTGKWDGEYDSTVTQRRGAISFDLDKASSSAHGSIMMTTFASEKTSKNQHGPKKIRRTTTATTTTKKETPLAIDFVAVKGGKVNGDVTPYFDPRFNTTVFTNFEGTLTGNRLEGTFTSRIGQTGNSYSGTWWAIRK